MVKYEIDLKSIVGVSPQIVDKNKRVLGGLIPTYTGNLRVGQVLLLSLTSRMLADKVLNKSGLLTK